MPDAKNNAKATGDTHLPEIEERGRPVPAAPAGSAGHRPGPRPENEGRAGKGVNQAGYLKDKDGGVEKDKP
ncbi:hypothetical protein HK414_15130 [Ramlibacter terrae]|uniref:Uncharacterized protein n=1 Tax=Ramlibacter terrae TaxID=2732511 RepID=A0ABX6P3A3_9BURK|nr:hypothetical protein HK414_15130 [Ramlibacter terrae]